MSALTALKLITAKKPQQQSPVVQRRNKLSKKLWEQMELCKALADGRQYTPTKLKSIVDPDTGTRRSIETAKRVKQWWWVADNGKINLSIRYGAKTIALNAKGATAVELASTAELLPTFELIKQSVEEGSLDAQIEAASLKLREGFGK